MRRMGVVLGGIVTFVLLTAEAGTCGATPSASSPSTAPGSPGSSVAPSTAPKPTFVTFGNGNKIVGTDVRAGTYRTRHNSSGCYMARLSGFGGGLDDIIANENSDGPVVVTILKTDKGFVSDNCDTWTSDLSTITVAGNATFGSGDFIVGTDLKPGTYRSAASSGCNWARLKGFGHTLGETIANGTTDNGAVVAISVRDKGFESSGCAAWNKV
jgi:hypothetical protein